MIRADAGLKAQITMGEADGEATKIYADAFTKDKDFYAFWRRMEAYKQAFGRRRDHGPEPRQRLLPLLQRPHGGWSRQVGRTGNRPSRRRCGSLATPPS